jgi:hypothetical protein
MKLYCPVGEHEVSVAFQPAAGERWCPEHKGTHLQPLPSKPGKGFRADNESPARKRARQAFNRAVKTYRCFYSAFRTSDGKPRRPDHTCIYPLDAHHLVEKQWIERNYADLEEDRLLIILFDPRLGAPLCRLGHEGVKALRIYWDEVSEEAKEAAREHDERWLDVLTPGGIQRQSIFAELRRVCPVREAVSAR